MQDRTIRVCGIATIVYLYTVVHLSCWRAVFGPELFVESTGLLGPSAAAFAEALTYVLAGTRETLAEG